MAHMKDNSLLKFCQYALGMVIIAFVTGNIAHHAGVDIPGSWSMGLLMAVGVNNLAASLNTKDQIK